MRFWTACLLVSALLASAPGQDSPHERPKTAQALLERLAKIQGLEAHFVEEKHLALLAIPLKSSGSLYVMRPGHLARIIEKPERSQLTITPDELRMSDREGTEVLDLRQNDEVRVFVTSIMRVFLGDRKNLERSYDMLFELDATDRLAWSLRLTPKKKPLSQMLRTLELRGKGNSIARIELVEPNGDRTVTTIVEADSKRRFSDDEKLRLFGIGAKADKAKKH